MLTTFLLSLAVVCGLTGVLALLIVLADATIGNYGEVGVTINERRSFRTAGGRTLLATLRDEQVFIPSACGGRGSCGLCKVRVTSGGGAPLPTETAWLSPEERRGGVRVSCQLKVRGDLSIVIPEEQLGVRRHRATVARLRDLTYDIKEVRLRLEDPPAIDFVAGQFIQFEVPPYELTDEPVYRAYSIASEPRERGEIELEIRLVPDGICSTYVHRHLKAGDGVTVNGPYGSFFLREGEREMICIAGGSGMAPIKSILLDMLARGIRRPVRYFFGARARRDLFLVEQMRELEQRLPDFRFIPALSAPGPEDAWTGETGLITEVVARHVQRGEEAEAYLCGSPFMIDACVKVLRERGVPEERIYFDRFG